MRKIVLFGWFIFSLIVFSSVLISPQFFKYIGLLGFAIPIVMVVNLILLIFGFIYNTKSKWFFLVLALIAYPFYSSSFRFFGNEDTSQTGIKVLSHNIKWFVDTRNDDHGFAIKWMRDQEADIMCFQEFYPLKGIQKRLGEGYYISSDKHLFHTAIFSKHPIVNDGLLFEGKVINNIRFADIKIDTDTIRVYNLHLESMGIDPDNVQDSDRIRASYEDVGIKFISASQVRTRQVNALIEHMDNCKYPILLTGDFNDVPYSYNYIKLKKYLNNAFESRGSGLGASYNAGIPFLRIDQQFYSSEFEVKAFKTERDVYLSDHFPLIGIYQLTN